MEGGTFEGGTGTTTGAHFWKGGVFLSSAASVAAREAGERSARALNVARPRHPYRAKETPTEAGPAAASQG